MELTAKIKISVDGVEEAREKVAALCDLLAKLPEAARAAREALAGIKCRSEDASMATVKPTANGNPFISTRENVAARMRELYFMAHGRHPSDEQLKAYKEEFFRREGWQMDEVDADMASSLSAYIKAVTAKMLVQLCIDWVTDVKRLDAEAKGEQIAALIAVGQALIGAFKKTKTVNVSVNGLCSGTPAQVAQEIQKLLDTHKAAGKRH